MSDDDQPQEMPPAKARDRLTQLGYSKTRLKPAVLKELSNGMRYLIELMVSGTQDEALLGRLNPEKEEARTDPDTGRTIRVIRRLERGEPFTLEQAADAARIKRRNARDLITQAIFRKELDRQLQALRDSAKAKALHTQIQIMTNEGTGKAADRKVQLEAADRILEREGQRQGGPTVNVNVNSQMVTPGYVIRLPAKREPIEIDGKVVPSAPALPSRTQAEVVELRKDGRQVVGTWPTKPGPEAA
jgi:hypothetical protein